MSVIDTDGQMTVALAREMAIEAHGDQKYGQDPYVTHLDDVAALCEPFGVDAVVLAYLHDTLEDTTLPRAKIVEVFGERIARCVDALTDSPGVNRKERKRLTYQRFAAIDADGPQGIALVVKAADRLANVRRSQKDKSQRLLDMYYLEHTMFRGSVFRPGLNDAMFEEIDEILKVK